MIHVETRREGEPTRTVAVLGSQSLEFTIPPGGRLELAPQADGRTVAYTVDAEGKPIGECSVPDADAFGMPVSVGSGQLPS